MGPGLRRGDDAERRTARPKTSFKNHEKFLSETTRKTSRSSANDDASHPPLTCAVVSIAGGWPAGQLTHRETNLCPSVLPCCPPPPLRRSPSPRPLLRRFMRRRRP